MTNSIRVFFCLVGATCASGCTTSAASNHGLGFFKTVSESSPHWFTPNEHMIATHLHAGRFGSLSGVSSGKRQSLSRRNLNQFLSWTHRALP